MKYVALSLLVIGPCLIASIGMIESNANNGGFILQGILGLAGMICIVLAILILIGLLFMVI